MVAKEGWPWLLVTGLVTGVMFQLEAGFWTAVPGVLFVCLFLLFRDPGRAVPALPLAILAPVDGRVIAIEETTEGLVTGRWQMLRIRCNHLGAYTVRAPIEGHIHSVRKRLRPNARVNGLWLRSEEEDDLVLLFPSRGIGPGPRAFVRYGERVGQGQRFAYLRLAATAEVYFPVNARLEVAVGDSVTAGTGVLAELRRD